MLIDGKTELIAHLGWPTHAFKAPMIYNPYFESVGVNAVVVPMGCRPSAFAEVLRGVFALENIRGALITMPHKVPVVGLLNEVSPAAQVANDGRHLSRERRYPFRPLGAIDSGLLVRVAKRPGRTTM